MVYQLKGIFPTLTIYNEQEEPSKETIQSKKYVWFTTSKKEIIRIDKSEVSKRDIQLLNSFLQKYPATLPNNTVQEKLWIERIKNNSNKKANNSFRFVYFTLQQHMIQP